MRAFPVFCLVIPAFVPHVPSFKTCCSSGVSPVKHVGVQVCRLHSLHRVFQCLACPAEFSSFTPRFCLKITSLITVSPQSFLLNSFSKKFTIIVSSISVSFTELCLFEVQKYVCSLLEPKDPACYLVHSRCSEPFNSININR